MEEKKSYKADLEHRRPMFFAVAFIAMALLFVGVLYLPFPSLERLAEEFFDDYSMELDIKANEQDDMISAAQPQQVEQKETMQLNKVDETTELAPEQLEQSKPTEEAEETEEEETDEEPPINLNGDDPEKLRIVEQLPEFPGGMVEFMKWLTATLKYPDNALRRKVQGRVMVSFIVNTDGTVSDIRLMKGVDRQLDAEALRVVKLMPKWKPGIDEGKPCRTMIAIPVVFAL